MQGALGRDRRQAAGPQVGVELLGDRRAAPVQDGRRQPARPPVPGQRVERGVGRRVRRMAGRTPQPRSAAVQQEGVQLAIGHGLVQVPRAAGLRRDLRLRGRPVEVVHERHRRRARQVRDDPQRVRVAIHSGHQVAHAARVGHVAGDERHGDPVEGQVGLEPRDLRRAPATAGREHDTAHAPPGEPARGVRAQLTAPARDQRRATGRPQWTGRFRGGPAQPPAVPSVGAHADLVLVVRGEQAVHQPRRPPGTEPGDGIGGQVDDPAPPTGRLQGDHPAVSGHQRLLRCGGGLPGQRPHPRATSPRLRATKPPDARERRRSRLREGAGYQATGSACTP